MTIENIIDDIEIASIQEALMRRDISLWILPDANPTDISMMLHLPWINIWNAAKIDIEGLWSGTNSSRSILKVTRPEQDHATFRVTEFVRIYDLLPSLPDDRRHQRIVDRLKDKVEEVTGLLCFIGAADKHWDEVLLVCDLAPASTILIIDHNKEHLPPISETEIFFWRKDVSNFVSVCQAITNTAGDPAVVNLKGARGLRANARLLEDISPYWTFLSSSITTPPPKVDQELFDSFLNGDEAWQAYAAGVPYHRQATFFKEGKGVSGRRRVNLIEEIIHAASELEYLSLGPNEQLKQAIIFCETGSGITTFLRQAAMKLALLGFPCLVSKPFPKNFGGRSLENFIIEIQDLWLLERKGKGSGTGMIPVCLFVDKDGERALVEHGLPKSLQSLGRKILLVRAVERSEDEIAAATGVYTLPAEVDSEELIALGNHLRRFAETQGLAKLPSDDEWRAFHEAIGKLRRYEATVAGSESCHTPPLFMIGIYPFIKDRVLDENSLEQYYYKKWQALGNENAKEIVRILAVAGAYGLSIPVDTLRRHPDIDVLLINSLDKNIQRDLDVFIKWGIHGQSTKNWYLHMRHAAIGTLLSRGINPSEGDFPYTAVLPLLKNLSTKEEDLWFAGTISHRLGRYFKRYSTNFSLETDTSIQRAARSIFNAIPESVKMLSRTVRHHQGRYHLHILHACCESLEHPGFTTIATAEVFNIANLEFQRATEFLLQAAEVRGNGEPVSHVYNTLAKAYFTLADILKSKDPASQRALFDDALEYEERAIKHDPGNGHALFQYVRGILDAFTSSNDEDIERDLELLSRAESKLAELIRLHEEKRWRNVDPIEAEKSIGGLVQNHLEVWKTLSDPKRKDRVFAFEAKHPEAILFLKVRSLIGGRSFEDAFKDPSLVVKLRSHRNELQAIQRRSTRSDIYLYKLYLADPIGRLQFRSRLDLLEKIKSEDPDEFEAYRHDEASLYCQLDKIDIGARKFREIREYRQYEHIQWFWLNEKALLDPNNTGRPRELALEVIDPRTGRACIRNTDINVKYQPYQFSEMERRRVFTAFIRFTLNGMQAVNRELINNDLAEMGLK